LLLANSFLYEACLDWVESLKAEPDSCVDAISKTALQAWYYNPGRFADGALENRAFRLGLDEYRQVTGAVPRMELNPGRKARTLHVVTEVYPVGGHTRFLVKWILRDRNSAHAAVLTQQLGPLPGFFEQAIAKAGGGLLCLPPSESKISRATQLRNLSKEFDRVVLHSHPNDPIPILAFASKDLPPVAMFNIGHFSFSLGSTVSDLVINTADYFESVSKKFRYARRTIRLTTLAGLNPLGSELVDKESAKSQLGFDSSARVVMTIASEHYFRPIAGYNFFLTSSRLLKAIPDIHLIVVGVPSTSSLIPLELRENCRCHFPGTAVNPEPYYHAADLCLESFPMPSLGGLVESVAHGEAFPVPVYGVGESILRVQLSPLLTFSYRPRDEEDYVDYIARLILDLPGTREQARQLRLSILQYDQDFGQHLDNLNQTIDRLSHEPGEIGSSGLIDSYDTRTLAQLNFSDLTLAARIDELLPFDRAVRSQFLAIAKGLVSPREGAGRISHRLSDKENSIAERDKAIRWLRDELNKFRLEARNSLQIVHELETAVESLSTDSLNEKSGHLGGELAEPA